MTQSQKEPIHLKTRDAVAKALGMSKAAIQQRHNRGTMPGPDAVFEGANGARSYGWLPETIERWAPEIGRSVDWNRQPEPKKTAE